MSSIYPHQNRGKNLSPPTLVQVIDEKIRTHAKIFNIVRGEDMSKKLARVIIHRNVLCPIAIYLYFCFKKKHCTCLAERNKLATLARLKLKLDFSKGRAYFQRRSLAVCFCKRSSNKIIPGRNIDLLTSSAAC